LLLDGCKAMVPLREGLLAWQLLLMVHCLSVMIPLVSFIISGIDSEKQSFSEVEARG
jgi:hypothetical protein